MYAAVVPSNLDQNEQSVFRPKMPKNPTFWGVHTYRAYIRGGGGGGGGPPPPPPRPNHFHGC